MPLRDWSLTPTAKNNYLPKKDFLPKCLQLRRFCVVLHPALWPLSGRTMQKEVYFSLVKCVKVDNCNVHIFFSTRFHPRQKFLFTLSMIGPLPSRYWNDFLALWKSWPDHVLWWLQKTSSDILPSQASVIQKGADEKKAFLVSGISNLNTCECTSASSALERGAREGSQAE